MEQERREEKPRIGILDLERRKYPRFKVNLPLDYSRLETQVTASGRAINVSEGGLEIYFPEEMKVGDQLKLRLFFSSESELNTITVIAEVVWIDILSGDGEFRSGVRLIDVKPEDFDKLKSFLLDLTR